MNDLISRQDAIRKYQEVCNGIKCGECPFLIKVNTEKGSHLITDCKLEAFLHNLPSVELRTGKWIEEGRIMDIGDADNILCSECGKYALWSHHYPNEEVPRYCPNCGAKMEGGE